MKRAFCAWLCPVGTLSEYLWKAGRKLFGRNLVLPAGSTSRCAPSSICSCFLRLHHRQHERRRPGRLHGAALRHPRRRQNAALLRAHEHHRAHCHRRSHAALRLHQEFLVPLRLPVRSHHVAGLACQPLTIRRDTRAASIAASVPRPVPWISRRPLIQIRSIECTACLECVAVCATENALQFALSPAQRRSRSGVCCRPVVCPALARPHPATLAAAILLAALFFGGVGLARITRTGKPTSPTTSTSNSSRTLTSRPSRL